MICSKCGAMIADNTSFCTNCGAPVQHQNNLPVNQPIYNGVYTNPSLDAGPIMKQGIIAAALSELGIPGIIIGAIAQNKVKNYLAQGGERNGKIKAASICSKFGIGFGIGMTVLYTLCFFIGFFSAV